MLARSWLLLLLLSLCGALLPGAARAQAVRLSLQDASLEEALALVREQAEVDLVYAVRLVRDKRVTCRYEGTDVAEALRVVLAGTGLRAEPIRRRQYVIVRAGSAAEPASTGPVAARGTLSGFVVAAGSGEVLPGAHVYLPSLQVGTITNASGYFALPGLPLGLYPLRFSYLGYQAEEIFLETDSTATVVLRPAAIVEREVVVEARSEPVDLVTVPGMVPMPVGRLSGFPAFLGEQDLFQALRSVPNVRGSGEAGGELIVRGGSGDQNLYLLDGVPIYHPWHTFGLFSTFQTETLKNVRLYKGSLPAEYGGRLSAVLDAQMKDGSQSEPGASAALSPISARMMAEVPVGRIGSFMAAGRRSYLDLFLGRKRLLQSPNGVGDTLRIGYYLYDLSAKLTLRPSRWHHFSVSAYRGRDNLKVRVPFQSSLFDPDSWQAADLAFGIGHEWGNALYSLQYRYRYGRRFFLTATAYESGYRAQENTFVQPTSNTSVDSRYQVRLRDHGLKVDADYYHALEHQFRVGAQLVRHRFRSVLRDTVRLTAGSTDVLHQSNRLDNLEGSVYAQDTWQPTPEWQVQPGVRLSVFSSRRRLYVNPRLYARYAAHPTLMVLKGGVSAQTQYMHRLRDRYSYVYDIASSHWVPVSDRVRPATGIQWALGAESVPLPWLTLAVDAYWRRFRDVLVPEDAYRSKDGLEGPGIEIGTLLGQYTPAFAKSYGIEVAGRVEQGPWQLWLSYTGSRTFRRTPLLADASYHPAVYDIPHLVQASMQWSRRRWTLAVAGELRSGDPYTVPVARYAIGDPLEEDPVRYLYRPLLNNGRLPGYARLDLALGHHFRLIGLDWRAQLQVFNVTNRRNAVGQRYDPEDPEVRPVQSAGLPILPVVEINVEW